jgi:glycosyltransferase involved in cell wall biosynthesis
MNANQKIRVLQLVSGLDVQGASGGQGRFAATLAQRINPREFQTCALWTYHTPSESDQTSHLEEAGIPVFRACSWEADAPYYSFWNAGKNLWAWAWLLPEIDLIHSHSEFGDLLTPLLRARFPRVKLLRTVHNREWVRRPLRRLTLTHLLYPLVFHGEIAVSQGLQDQLNQRPLARLLRRRAIHIPNGLDLSRFADPQQDPTSKREQLGFSQETILLGSVGRLDHQKGHTYLLAATARVLRQLPKVHLVIIGDGVLEPQLKQQTHNLGIASQVHFMGPRKDVDEILPALDLYVSASLWEGLPTAILESMAAGTPVIATDIPGTNEIIRHGENGWLVPPRNPTALAEAILHLLTNPHLRTELAKKGLQRVKAFDMDKIVKQHEMLYRNLVKRT